MSKLENPNKLFPMFMSAKLGETKAFYVDKLGWKATYDLPSYLQVRIGDVDGPELCFMNTETGSAAGSPNFAGQGVVVSVPVEDADRHHAALRERGVQALSEPSLKPWGWRSFEVRDPNGVILDFFHVAESPMPPQA
ncbi:MAG TPA: VOC family protein [Enhygromyxa sp.]|nr:VOC family protein [Enhygromyxa sp.]